MKKTLFVLMLLTLQLPVSAQTYNFTFETDNEGWLVDYADYPVLSASDSVGLYELLNSRSMLPASIMPSQYGIKIRGNNHSDDLFMFLKKKITGLAPNTAYKINYTLDIASNAPTNATGVGGSPGEDVVIKAGATVIEPQKVNIAGTYRMNINKSNQGMPGPDMDTIGNVGVADTTTVYHLIHRNNATHPFHVTTDATGELWLIIGTESGFEAVTELYYANIYVQLDQSEKINGPVFTKEPVAFPNPVTKELNITGIQHPVTYKLYNATGMCILHGSLQQSNNKISVQSIPPGIYTLEVNDTDGQRKMLQVVKE